MAELGRVSTFNVFRTTQSAAGRIQAELTDLQTQLASGYRSQTFAGISTQTTQFLRLEDRLSRIGNYLDNNRTTKIRLDSTGTALDQVIQTATQLKNIIAQRRSQSDADSVSFGVQVDNLWQTLAGELNISVDGRYLFSGSDTLGPAVDIDNFPTLQAPGVPDDNYYIGDDQDLLARPDDGISFIYNVRANDPAIQKLFAGLATAKAGDTSGDDADLAQAFDLVQEGIRGIINLKSKVNANSVTIDIVNTNLSALQTYWKGIKEDIANTDIVAVSTQVAIDQGILQASFQTFARITSLKLSDFLR